MPRLRDRPGLEPRGAIWVAVHGDGWELQLINTHLGLRRRERLLQAEALLGPEWLGHPACRAPRVLCGDLNDRPASLVCRRLTGLLRDAQLVLDGHRPQRTWLTRIPLARIDHVFVGQEVDVLGIEVPRTELTRTASDHLPLIVEVGVPKAEQAPAEGVG